MSPHTAEDSRESKVIGIMSLL